MGVGWLTALGLLLLAGCQGSEAVPEGAGDGGPPPAFVEIAAVAPETLVHEVELVGQLEARERVVLEPEIEGVVAAVGFEEGERVEEGRVLFRLRDAEQRARLAEVEARQALAADRHRRLAELGEQQVISEADLVRAEQELAVARAETARAEVDLDRMRIRAPFAGRVGARLVSPGARVGPGVPLVSLHAVDELRLAYTLPEGAAGIAREGLPVQVRVAEFPGEEFPGTTYFVAPAVSPERRLLLSKARVPNPDGRLRPGQFAKVRVEVARREDAIVVPDAAIVRDPEGTFVWRVGEGDRAERVGVTIGLRTEGRVEVTEGLTVGDRIVVAGTNKVRPSAVVQPPPEGSGPES